MFHLHHTVKIKTDKPNPRQIFRNEHPWKATLLCWNCIEEAKKNDTFVGWTPSLCGWKTTCEHCNTTQVNYRQPDDDATAATDPELALEEAFNERREGFYYG